jgi:hypothetical protein
VVVVAVVVEDVEADEDGTRTKSEIRTRTIDGPS